MTNNQQSFGKQLDNPLVHDEYDDNGNVITNHDIETTKEVLREKMRVVPSFEFFNKDYVDEFISKNSDKLDKDLVNRYVEKNGDWLFTVKITSGFFINHKIVYTALNFTSNNQVEVKYNVVDSTDNPIKSKALDETVENIVQVLLYNASLEELVQMEKLKRGN